MSELIKKLSGVNVQSAKASQVKDAKKQALRDAIRKRIADSKKGAKEELPLRKRTRISDSEKRSLRTKRTERAERPKLSDSAKARILARLKKMSDAKKENKNSNHSFAVKDSIKRRQAIRRIKDELAETTSTDEAKEVALKALEEVDAPTVVETVIDILHEVADKLPEGGAEFDEEIEVSDSMRRKRRADALKAKKALARKRCLDSIRKKIASKRETKVEDSQKKQSSKTAKPTSPKKVGSCK